MSDVIRKDPRLAWIARNRLHPRHGELSGQPLRGPTGLLRRTRGPSGNTAPAACAGSSGSTCTATPG
ncbi:hypothetical protein MBH78_20995 [Oceanimonas sp. NS1]|nr:hypothetical protein [Oceanimonas sp. NS1]